MNKSLACGLILALGALSSEREADAEPLTAKPVGGVTWVGTCLANAPDLGPIAIPDISQSPVSLTMPLPANRPRFFYGTTGCRSQVIADFTATSATKLRSVGYLTPSVAVGGRDGEFPEEIAIDNLLEAGECASPPSGTTKEACKKELAEVRCRRLVTEYVFAWKKHGWPKMRIWGRALTTYRLDGAFCRRNPLASSWTDGAPNVATEYSPNTVLPNGQKARDADRFQMVPKPGETDTYRVIAGAYLAERPLTDAALGKPTSGYTDWVNDKASNPNDKERQLPLRPLVR